MHWESNIIGQRPLTILWLLLKLNAHSCYKQINNDWYGWYAQLQQVHRKTRSCRTIWENQNAKWKCMRYARMMLASSAWHGSIDDFFRLCRPFQSNVHLAFAAAAQHCTTHTQSQTRRKRSWVVRQLHTPFACNETICARWPPHAQCADTKRRWNNINRCNYRFIIERERDSVFFFVVVVVVVDFFHVCVYWRIVLHEYPLSPFLEHNIYRWNELCRSLAKRRDG